MDEVHLLEKAAADLESAELSLFSLRAWIRRQNFSKGAAMVEAVSRLMSELSSDGRLDDGFGASRETVAKVRSSLAPVYERLKKVRKGDSISQGEREELMSSLNGVLNPREDRMGLSFSPTLRYPSILVGPLTAGAVLGYLWKSVVAAVGSRGRFICRQSEAPRRAGTWSPNWRFRVAVSGRSARSSPPGSRRRPP